SLLISVFLVFLFQNTRAQELKFAPTGATWTHSIQMLLPWVSIYNEWISIGDTSIQNKTCQIIQRFGEPTVDDFTNRYYVYDEARVVYFFNFFNNDFSVLFDFNKEVGESWITIVDSCEIAITVDSTGIEMINGFALKSMFITRAGSDGSHKIIEQIGFLDDFSPYDQFLCTGSMFDGTYAVGIRCYTDTIIGFHNFQAQIDCHYVHSSKDLAKNQIDIKISPNPIYDKANIELGESLRNANCMIYNSLGQELKHITNIWGNQLQIDRVGLSAGHYYMHFRDKSGILGTQRFVVFDR
ncbi:MAG: T9SS type A sorting domain-containing protein, partial [Saprospiraceae bacterium]